MPPCSVCLGDKESPQCLGFLLRWAVQAAWVCIHSILLVGSHLGQGQASRALRIPLRDQAVCECTHISCYTWCQRLQGSGSREWVLLL